MSSVTPSPILPWVHNAAVPTDFVWRLNVNQYHDMIRGGILTEDDPVELLQGWLIPKMPKNPPHRAATRLTRMALEQLTPAGWYVDTQEPITTPDSEPEPDVMIVRGETRQYLDRHPGPEDLALVVEVAEATLERDRTLKKQIYAVAGIAVYWIINLPQRRVEVYTDPSGPGDAPDYAQRRDYGIDDAVPVVIQGQEINSIAVRDLLP
jgi:Uma2 family endonuclease